MKRILALLTVLAITSACYSFALATIKKHFIKIRTGNKTTKFNDDITTILKDAANTASPQRVGERCDYAKDFTLLECDISKNLQGNTTTFSVRHGLTIWYVTRENQDPPKFTCEKYDYSDTQKGIQKAPRESAQDIYNALEKLYPKTNKIWVVTNYYESTIYAIAEPGNIPTKPDQTLNNALPNLEQRTPKP